MFAHQIEQVLILDRNGWVMNATQLPLNNKLQVILNPNGTEYMRTGETIQEAAIFREVTVQ